MNLLKPYLRGAAVVLLLAVSSVARAVPAWPGLRSLKQPDGTVLTCRLMGDEHFHSLVTTDGYLIAPDALGAIRYVTEVTDDGEPTLSDVLAHNADRRSADELAMLQATGMSNFGQLYRQQAARRAPRRALNPGSFPTKGEVRGLVLMVEFKDNAFQPEYTRDLYQRQLNDEGYTDYAATGSARDYFIAQSMGQFTPSFDVVGPIKLSRVMGYYGGNSQSHDMNPGEMVREACQIAHDSLGVDFSQYDYNDDGDVDFVFIIYAGYGENYGASPNTVWPHMSTLTDQHVDCQLDGKRIDRYACSCELNGATGTELDGIGAVCHEFGHVLGLPDFYNTFDPRQTQLGSWDVMDGGSYNNNSRTPPSYTAFERYSLGWMELTELSEPSDSFVVEEITQSNTGYRISTADENEFFTIENHQQEGWDRYQAGRGLMIIHVAYDYGAWNNNGVNAGMLPRYDLMEADGTQGTEQATDLYPIDGNDMFTDYSSPNSMSRYGEPTEKGISRIRQNDDGTISFRFMKDRLKRPVLLPPSDITHHSFRANWQAVDDAVGYSLSVRELLPDSLNPIVFDEDFSLMQDEDYPKSGFQTIDRDIADYVRQPGWQASEVYASNGYVRIGSYGKSGSLSTPAVSLTGADGRSTLAFHAVSYPNKKVSYTVRIADADTDVPFATFDLKADKHEQGVLLQLDGAPVRSRITFETLKERLFLNDVRVLNCLADSAAVWSAGPRQWTIDSIVGTSYVVEGLDSCRTYFYAVTALAGGGLTSSLPSAEQQVVTDPLLSGVHLAEGSSAASVVSESWYDLSGRRVAPTARGVVVRRLTYSDGTVEHRKLLHRR